MGRKFLGEVTFRVWAVSKVIFSGDEFFSFLQGIFPVRNLGNRFLRSSPIGALSRWLFLLSVLFYIPFLRFAFFLLLKWSYTYKPGCSKLFRIPEKYMYWQAWLCCISFKLLLYSLKPETTNQTCNRATYPLLSRNYLKFTMRKNTNKLCKTFFKKYLQLLNICYKAVKNGGVAYAYEVICSNGCLNTPETLQLKPSIPARLKKKSFQLMVEIVYICAVLMYEQKWLRKQNYDLCFVRLVRFLNKLPVNFFKKNLVQ